MAKAKILEITLSVMGAGEYELPTSADDTNADFGSGAIEGGASSDTLVISVRIRGARKYARGRVRQT